MPIIAPPSTPGAFAGPGPFLATVGNAVVCKFGNAALPNGQGTMAWVDLNDQVNTVLTDFKSDDTNRQIGLEQLLYRARGTYLSDDFGPRPIILPLTYFEGTGNSMGQFLAVLSQAGEQQLTFDNATYILAKYSGASSRTLRRRYPPWSYDVNLEFVAKSPWFQDSSATTMAPLTLTVDAGQTFNITYAGSVFCEPVWTLHVPVTNAVVINSMQIKNTMAAEFLTVNFQSATAIPATTVRDVVIDCAASTAICTQTGESYDISGSFPKLYPPAGQVNPFTVIITPASGSSSGLTLACSHYPRWQI